MCTVPKCALIVSARFVQMNINFSVPSVNSAVLISSNFLQLLIFFYFSSIFFLIFFRCNGLPMGYVAVSVEQQPATRRRVVGSIPAGGALEVWPWTSVLHSLGGQ